MALTLNNFVGYETNGLEEALGTTGSPTLTTSPLRTGDWSLELNVASERYDIDAFESVADAGDYQMIGVAVYVDRDSGTIQRFLFAMEGTALVWELGVNNVGTMQLWDAEGVSIDTQSSAMTQGAWNYVEVLWQHQASGQIIVYVDGVQKMNLTARDLTDGGTFDTYRLQGTTTKFVFDDFYCMSGASGVGDFLGGVEVLRYQNRTNSATPDAGNALGVGVWQDVGETPLDVEATEVGYTDGGAVEGTIYTDDTASGNHGRHGPHGDSDIDGDANMKGAKWLHRLKRGTGPGTAHHTTHGNDVDTLESHSVTLTTGYASFFAISEALDHVPSSAEHFANGFGKASGGREIYCAEIWAFALHYPDKTMPALTAAKFPDQNYYVGPFGT